MKRLSILLLLVFVALPAQAGLDWICKKGSEIQVLQTLPSGPTAQCEPTIVGVIAEDKDQWYYQDGSTPVPAPEGPHDDELNFSWSSEAPGFVNPGNQPVFIWDIPGGTEAGTYTFTVTISDKGEHGGKDPNIVEEISVTVSEPTLTIHGPTTVCEDDTVTYVANVTPGSAGCVQWTCTGGGTVSTVEGAATTISWTAPGDYTVTATLGGVSKTFLVHVSPSSFTLNISASNDSPERGQYVSYSVSTSTVLDPAKDDVYYTWTFYGGDGSVVNNYNHSSPSWNGVMVQSGRIEVVVATACNSANASLDVTVDNRDTTNEPPSLARYAGNGPLMNPPPNEGNLGFSWFNEFHDKAYTSIYNGPNTGYNYVTWFGIWYDPYAYLNADMMTDGTSFVNAQVAPCFMHIGDLRTAVGVHEGVLAGSCPSHWSHGRYVLMNGIFTTPGSIPFWVEQYVSRGNYSTFWNEVDYYVIQPILSAAYTEQTKHPWCNVYDYAPTNFMDEWGNYETCL